MHFAIVFEKSQRLRDYTKRLALSVRSIRVLIVIMNFSQDLSKQFNAITEEYGRHQKEMQILEEKLQQAENKTQVSH